MILITIICLVYTDISYGVYVFSVHDVDINICMLT